VSALIWYLECGGRGGGGGTFEFKLGRQDWWMIHLYSIVSFAVRKNMIVTE